MDFKKIATRVVGTTAGVYAASILYNTVKDTAMKPAIKGMLVTAIGAFLPELMPKQKEIAESVGAGLIAYGMQKVLIANDINVAGISGDEPSEREYKLQQALTEVSGLLDEVSSVLEDSVNGDGDYVAKVNGDGDYVAEVEDAIVMGDE